MMSNIEPVREVINYGNPINVKVDQPYMNLTTITVEGIKHFLKVREDQNGYEIVPAMNQAKIAE